MSIAEPLQVVHSLNPAELHSEPVPEKPKLSLVPHIDPAGNIAEIFKIYQTQKRECWFCEKIAGILQSGKEASEDEKWHFTTCVTTWQHHTKSEK